MKRELQKVKLKNRLKKSQIIESPLFIVATSKLWLSD